ncbi:M23 family metallopeptidase [Roseibium algae]|uniref:M23 family metallopeptidase n=1 Tax=Roseibium algae TaxID=3123038 RepID=A0ABU8TJK9_9HYPH
MTLFRTDKPFKAYSQNPTESQTAFASTDILRSIQAMRPRMTIAAASVFAVVSLGLIGSTAYLVLRDNGLEASRKQQLALETAYQDRIYRLRAEINRLASRQAIDRESVEQQVSNLIQRQKALNERHSVVSDLMKRAERNGIQLAIRNPLPAKKPTTDEDLLAAIADDDGSAMGGESEPLKDPLKALGLRGSTSSLPEQPTAEKIQIGSDEQASLQKVQNDLQSMDQESRVALNALAVATEARIDEILSATRPLGVNLNTTSASDARSGVGGPYIPYIGTGFTGRAKRAERALTVLDGLKAAAKRLPINRPMKNARISSQFGPRIDPFLGRIAMHTGMDFKAPYGARVYASGPGTVIHAGRKGGYGNLVAIRHANGFISRYAHLSRLQVTKGDHVTAGDVIGNVGSTGRSTGPHLHYEIRLGTEPLNPAGFVKAGDKLRKMIDS